MPGKTVSISYRPNRQSTNEVVSLTFNYSGSGGVPIKRADHFLDIVRPFAVEDAVDPHDDPDIQLQMFIEWLLPWTLDDEGHEFQTALFELRSQALSNEAYRGQFTRADDLLREAVVDLIESGIEDGTFNEVNLGRVAEHILSTATGARFRRLTANDESAIRETRQELTDYVESCLLATG